MPPNETGVSLTKTWLGTSNFCRLVSSQPLGCLKLSPLISGQTQILPIRPAGRNNSGPVLSGYCLAVLGRLLSTQSRHSANQDKVYFHRLKKDTKERKGRFSEQPVPVPTPRNAISFLKIDQESFALGERILSLQVITVPPSMQKEPVRLIVGCCLQCHAQNLVSVVPC